MRIPGTTLLLPNSQLSWTGWSRAGQATSFCLTFEQRRNQRWLFDAGLHLLGTTEHRPQCIFLSHMHSDHVQGLCQILLQSTSSQECRVFYPRVEKEKFEKYLQAFLELVRNDNDSSNLHSFYNAQFLPVSPGDELDLPDQCFARAVACTHRKVAIGYSLFQRHYQLRPEYRGLDNTAIRELVQSGVTIKELRVDPLICYLGDTTVQVFRDYPEVLQEHKVIATECTFYTDRVDQTRATRTQHTDWTSLLPIVIEHSDTLFLLQHPSQRTSDAAWWKLVQPYRNVHLMMEQPPGAAPCSCFVCQGGEGVE